MRLDRTQLLREASDLQEVYLHDQYHETLLQYLENEFSICENRSLFIQVSVKYLFTLKCFCHMCIGSCLLFHIEKTTNTSLPVHIILGGGGPLGADKRHRQKISNYISLGFYSIS